MLSMIDLAGMFKVVVKEICYLCKGCYRITVAKAIIQEMTSLYTYQTQEQASDPDSCLTFTMRGIANITLSIRDRANITLRER